LRQRVETEKNRELVLKKLKQMFKFEKLKVWEKSIELVDLINDLIDARLPKKHQFSLGEQLRRAVLSISANIAEGSGRLSIKEANHFYNIAKASTYEVISLTVVFKNRKCINLKEYQLIYTKTEEIAKMLSGLMKKKNWN